MKLTPANNRYTFRSDKIVPFNSSRRDTSIEAGYISSQTPERLYRIFGLNSGAGDNFEIQTSMAGEIAVSMTREEIDAKLQLNEARLDTKVVQLDGKIDRLTDLITNLRTDIDRQASASARDFSEVKDELKASRGDNRFTRWTIVVTAVTSAVAIVGLVLAVQSSLLSAFQTGLATKANEQSVMPETK